jgi:hypothetical protein
MLKINQTQAALTKAQLENTKGGILVYCEEKRRKMLLGPDIVYQEFTIVQDNKLTLTMMRR